jgi:hypothetical protein
MRLCKSEFVVEWGMAVDTNFLKAYAERCRSLAENADEFTKRRLLDLAANYDKRVKAPGTLGSHEHSHSAAPSR